MKKSEVKIGEVYRMKVGQNLTTVRITGDNPHGGWDSVNVKTNRAVRIKSPQRLRGRGDEPATTLAPAEKKQSGKKKADGEKHPSGLAAAAQVLAQAKQPLNTRQMVAQMLAKGLWRTSGKTPAATIYAAIIREIAKKGDASRFAKADRGMFTLKA